MTDYTKTTNFTAKDNLPVGNVNKKINGSLFDTEFDAIATAVATKANIAGPTFTGTVTAPTLAFTTATGTNLLTTAIKANDGTASATIADSTGVMTIASAVLTTADINGGTFDGVVGGTTPAAGSFTTVTTSGIVSVDDTTDSTSGTTGSIHTDGGIGAAKDIVAGATVKALGDTSAGDAAAMGYTATEGLVLTGQGSTYDVTLKNDADVVVAGVPTGTTNLNLTGNLEILQKSAPSFVMDADENTDPIISLRELGVDFAQLFVDTSANAVYLRQAKDTPSSHLYVQTRNGNRSWQFGGDGVLYAPAEIDVSSGGIYIGGTGSANLLDDYEEGTWTFTLYDAVSGGNASATTVTAYYTKIGRLVTCRVFSVNNISTAGMTGGNLLYFSLPFTPNGSALGGGGSITVDNLAFPTSSTQLGVIIGADARGLIYGSGSGAADDIVQVQDITTGTTDIVRMTFSYYT